MAKTKTKGTAKTVSDTPVPQPITIRSTNPKIMADNILKLEESIKAADVSANPTGTAEETLLSTIGIDGKKYELGPSAENTSYDNTNSGLEATDSQSAIDEIVTNLGKIEKNGAIWAVLNDQSVSSTTAATVNTTLERSLSKYPILAFTFVKAGIARASVIIPSELFVAGTNVDLSYVGGDNARQAISVSYVSDTSVSVQASANNSDFKLNIYALSVTKTF